MIRIAVVEDEEEAQNDLLRHLRQYEQEKNIRLIIDTFSSGIDFISDYNARYDIVFMDIRLPLMDGMQCAVSLRRLDEDVALIFVTCVGQYAIRGYEVNAMGYMIKPIGYSPFVVLMDKVLKKIVCKETKYIVLSLSDGVRKIPLRDLWFVEIIGHYLIYHTYSGTYREFGHMKKIEEQLKNDAFFRCNNSYLINLRFVQAVQGNEVTVGEERVPVSRRRRKDLMIALNNYFKNGGG